GAQLCPQHRVWRHMDHAWMDSAPSAPERRLLAVRCIRDRPSYVGSMTRLTLGHSHPIHRTAERESRRHSKRSTCGSRAPFTAAPPRAAAVAVARVDADQQQDLAEKSAVSKVAKIGEAPAFATAALCSVGWS